MFRSRDEAIVVLDAGTGLGHRLVRQIRSMGVYCELQAPGTPPGEWGLPAVRGVVLAAVQDPPAGGAGLPLLRAEGEPVAGDRMRDFLFNQCGCRGGWSPAASIDQTVQAIRERVGDGTVVAGLSGGVDSMVAAALVHRAIGRRLVCIFVDHGLLRQGEAREVPQSFSNFGWNVVTVDAAPRFLAALAGVADPEEKRRRIGAEFIAVFEEEARRLGNMDFLLQGTLYTDVLESGLLSGQALKTHHNVGLPERMELDLLEPLRYLFKDEVRDVGTALGLPPDLIWRQPFPGPGLAIRVLGEVTPERLAILRQADAILREEIHRAGLSRNIWQYFALLTGARAVGTDDGRRVYGEALVLRAVTGQDAVTAQWARLPHDLLARLSDRILREVPGITRVAYDITAKPPGTIEWE